MDQLILINMTLKKESVFLLNYPASTDSYLTLSNELSSVLTIRNYDVPLLKRLQDLDPEILGDLDPQSLGALEINI